MCGKVLHRLVIPEGVQSFSLSPCGEPYKIVALKPEFKARPAARLPIQKGTLESTDLAMGFANIRAGTRYPPER